MNIKKIPFLFGIAFALTSLGCKENRTSTESAEATEYPDLGKKTHSSRTEILSPEEELAGFKLPEGFIIELVASERDGIVNPIDLTFDDAGRLWTQTAKMYPLDPVSDIRFRDALALMENPEARRKHPNFKRILDLYQGETKGEDKILVLSNLYNSKKTKVNVWADGLAIPQSILPYKNGSYVAQGSEMFFLEDTDKDGKSDKRTPLFTGFGYTDTHTMAHTLLRGPGNWIHFSHGALNKGEVRSLKSDAKTQIDYSKIARFSLDAEKIELTNAGLNNIWGFQLRGDGQWFGCEANDLGYSIVPMEGGTAYPGIGRKKLRPYQPYMPAPHEFRVGGTGISGLAFADDSEGSFPAEWKDVALLANPITSTINAVRIVRNPDGSISAEHLPDLLTSEDDWFRPVNMEFGPDGALYIADWYNKIVSHNEVTTNHPDRDKSHGRIWRIRHTSQKVREVPNMYEVPTNDLPSHLKSPSLWEKRAAWHQISDRPIEETKGLADELVSIAADTNQGEITRIVVLWALEGIHHYDESLMKKLVSSSNDALRREAVRSLMSFSLDASTLAKFLKGPAKDNNAMVRSQALRTLEGAQVANAETIGVLVNACKPALDNNDLGGGYERNFERYLARKALESYPNELWEFLNTAEALHYEPSNLLWASQALPKEQRENTFLKFWKKTAYNELDAPTFIMVAKMLDNTAIYDAVSPVLTSEKSAQHHVALALEHVSEVKSDALATLLTKPTAYLLKSGDATGQQLGLQAVGKLGIHTLRKEVVSFIENDPAPQTVRLVMDVLENEPLKNENIFAKLSKDEALDVANKTRALNIYAKANLEMAYTQAEKWFPDLGGPDQKSVVDAFANTSEGVSIVKRLFKGQKIPMEAFTLSSAEKISAADTEDGIGKTILAETKKRMEEEAKNYTKKFERFMAIAEKEDGDAQKGEQLFQVCLMCHRVGNKGQEYAPALDGSASRENEALLTAILDPDAAMEGSYSLYRVTLKDGSTMEGYLVKKDGNGTALGYMGGREQFISKAEIDREQFIRGRSFMPKGLIDNYSDEQIANFLAYIKTLR